MKSPGQKPARGLMPDIVIAESAADFVSGKDTALLAVSDLLEKK